ncbi:hypothetical protein [Geobacter sp. SVR]|uniref:hypothetical protein n=1 Tax=Geobacter sp. SVR TaxID=2495594 RepID=UPI00143EF495|nr:hypothetical protein [Geobacter sp. SVR]BCS54734.1 hypothetical protein GSVR_30420 [Geobacter sp. SVR]GCF86458.1 hypothetical protein GSbR_30580 [Geobacter sp. SVR]
MSTSGVSGGFAYADLNGRRFRRICKDRFLEQWGRQWACLLFRHFRVAALEQTIKPSAETDQQTAFFMLGEAPETVVTTF